MKNPKIEQKFPSIVKIQENGENENIFTYLTYKKPEASAKNDVIRKIFKSK